MSDLTPFQQLARFNSLAQLVWRPIRLRPYEQVLTYLESDQQVGITIEVFRYTELATRIRMEARGERTIAYTLPTKENDYQRKLLLDITLWDDEKPADLYIKGRLLTPSEYNERRAYELDCYRPGGNLDNVQSSDYAPKMQKHWGLPITTTPATEA